ncbi:hypothetical protein KKB43_01240 [Patescibacteria group bacterium]|nr:hypothetical protein [Patescibacteria group bacterium]MBU4579622.1 hypothetical protein [Patescibacteria group bacterium]
MEKRTPRIVPSNLMKKFLIKIIIVLFIGSLAGGSLFYFWKNKYAHSENQIIAEAELSDKGGKGDLQKPEGDKKISDTRAAIINYAEKNINKISPEKPSSGLVWRLAKIWFIDDKNFYVDYKDEVSNARRVLMSQANDGPAAEYEILGFFVPGENGWILKSGKDIGEAASLKLYEKNKATGEWTAK